MTTPTRKDLRRKLVAIAGSQAGYFSAGQALGAGYSYPAQRYHAVHQNWLRVGRGIFRLPRVAVERARGPRQVDALEPARGRDLARECARRPRARGREPRARPPQRAPGFSGQGRRGRPPSRRRSARGEGGPFRLLGHDTASLAGRRRLGLAGPRPGGHGRSGGAPSRAGHRTTPARARGRDGPSNCASNRALSHDTRLTCTTPRRRSDRRSRRGSTSAQGKTASRSTECAGLRVRADHGASRGG